MKDEWVILARDGTLWPPDFPYRRGYQHKVARFIAAGNPDYQIVRADHPEVELWLILRGL